MPDRVVKTTLVIDDRGSVKVLRGVGDEAGKTEGKLSHLDRSTRGLGKTFSGLKGMLAGGLGLVGAGGLAFGLADVISKTKEVVQETEKFHTVTGIGSQQSLKYSQALKARGLSGETVTKAFGFLAKNLRSAELQETKYAQAQAKGTLATQKQQLALQKAVQGGKALAIAQAQIGVTGAKATTELGRQAKALQELTHMSTKQFQALGSEEEKLKTVTKSFENLTAGQKKTRLERELFGKGGNALSIVLEKNNLSLNHYVGLVEKYYGTLKGGAGWEQQLLEKQSEAKLAWEGLQFQLGTKLTPVLIKVFEWFSKLSLEVTRGKGAWGELRKVGEEIFGVFKNVWKTFESLVGSGNALKIAIGGLLGVMVVSRVAGFASAISGLATAFGALGAAEAGAGGAAGLGGAVAAGGGVLAGGAGVAMLAKTIKGGAEIPGQLQKTFGGGGSPEHAIRPRPLTATDRARHQSAQRELERGEQEQRAGAGGVSGGVVAGMSHSKVELHVDGHKLTEVLLANPRARRHIAEATTIYSHGMAARGHG